MRGAGLTVAWFTCSGGMGQNCSLLHVAASTVAPETDEDLAGAHVTSGDEPTMWPSVEDVGKERDWVEVLCREA